MKHFGNRPGEECLPGSGFTDKNYIRLFNFNIICVGLLHQPFVMVVDSYRNYLLGHVLADHVLVEKMFYFGRLQKIDSVEAEVLLCAKLLVHNAVGLLDAMVTDMTFETGYKHADLLLCPAAE